MAKFFANIEKNIAKTTNFNLKEINKILQAIFIFILRTNARQKVKIGAKKCEVDGRKIKFSYSGSSGCSEEF